MTTYRIVPTEPSAKQIERAEVFCSMNGLEFSPSFAHALYSSMIDQCPDVSGEPVKHEARRRNRFNGEWSDWRDCPADMRRTVAEESVEDEWEIRALYTTPQPDPRDAEIARLKEAARVALEALERLQPAKLADGTYADKDCRITFAITALKGE